MDDFRTPRINGRMFRAKKVRGRSLEVDEGYCRVAQNTELEDGSEEERRFEK